MQCRANFGSVSKGDLSAAPLEQPLGRKLVIVALLAVCVFAVLSLAGDVRALGRSLAGFQFSALLAALGFVLCNYFVRFLRWQYYLRVLGVEVRASLSALVFLSGFIMSVTPGKMGEVFKSFLLHQYRGIAISRTVSAVVAERLLDLVALTILVSLAGYSFPDGLWVAGAGAGVVLTIVLASTVRRFGFWILDVLSTFKPLTALVPKLRNAYEALHALTRPTPFFVGMLAAIVGWAFECVATWWLVRGFGQSLMSLAGASYAYAAGTLAGALAMLPGGLGVAELGMSGLFRVVDPQLSLAAAAAATILVRLCTLWFGVVLGGIAFAALRAFSDKATPHTRE